MIRKTAFGERHSESAFAQIVSRLYEPVSNRGGNQILQGAFIVEVDLTGEQIDGFNQDDRIAVSPECGSGDKTHVLHHSNNADNRRRIDVFAKGLIVETDVPTRYWSAEYIAGFRHSVHHFAELPHDFGMFRIAEVETVGGSQRKSTRADDVATGFRDREFRSV